MESGARETLLAAVRAGNRLPAAARLAGVSPTTLSEWMRRGSGLDTRPATPVYVEFVEDVELAQATAEVYALATIRQAMSRDWRAAAWWLENASPEWRRRKERPEPEPPPAVRMAPSGETIIISAEDLRRFAEERIRMERGEPRDGVDEETRVRRSRLVSDRP